MPRPVALLMRRTAPGRTLDLSGSGPEPSTEDFAMFLLLFVALAFTVVARLAIVVRQDRPTDPPRSHTSEMDPRGQRFRVV